MYSACARYAYKVKKEGCVFLEGGAKEGKRERERKWKEKE